MKQNLVIEMLENLLDTESSQRGDAIRYLHELHDQALPCLIGALGIKKYSAAWPEIIGIIQGIETSSSFSAAVPVLSRFLKDSNKPIYNTAFDALKEMGETVIYEARDILAYNWSDDSWVQNVCMLLCEMQSVNQEILIPELIKLINIGSEKHPIDEPAFIALCKIQSPRINAVVPLLANKLAEINRDEFKVTIIENLPKFNKEAIRPFIPSISGNPALKSELIQIKTLEFMAWFESNT